jgi:RimJ/RimL family protein N-acetyltransferase
LSTRLQIEPLRAEHLPELAVQLRHPEVYKHIGGAPSLDDFILDRERALRGPSEAARNEQWLNYLVRERASSQILGRLEATLHDSIAEVAFLFSPFSWGKGFAHEALAWMHNEIQQSYGIACLWATTVPENTRCQALLVRSGYTQVQTGAPMLYSYEAGDLVFHLRSAA